jgi:hypothetical protein
MAINAGAAILRYMKTQTEMICNQAGLLQWGEYVIPVVNATSLWSEVGEELLNLYPEYPFVGAYHITKKGDIKWSLRSRGEFDVSAVAKLYGGGGHKNAAGILVTADTVKTRLKEYVEGVK